MCQWGANRNPWARYRLSLSPSSKRRGCKWATTDWAHHVGSSSGLITIVVMTLYVSLFGQILRWICWQESWQNYSNLYVSHLSADALILSHYNVKSFCSVFGQNVGMAFRPIAMISCHLLFIHHKVISAYNSRTVWPRFTKFCISSIPTQSTAKLTVTSYFRLEVPC